MEIVGVASASWFGPFLLPNLVAFCTAAGKQRVSAAGSCCKMFATLMVQILFCRQHLRCFWYGSDAVVDCWCELDGCYASVDTSYMSFLGDFSLCWDPGMQPEMIQPSREH